MAVVSTTEVPTGQMVTDVSQSFPATGRVMAAVEAIRGYENIKLATVRTYHEKLAGLQEEFAASASPTPVP